MKRLLTAVLSLGFLLSLTVVAEGQHRHSPQRRGYIGVGGGLGVPSGQFGTNAQLGWMSQGFAGYTTRGGLLGGRIDASFGNNPL